MNQGLAGKLQDLRESMAEECIICKRIAKILDDTNPYFVAELETGYVVIGDYQYFKGYTLFLCKEHKSELHDLDKTFRIKFLQEMSEVAEAVYAAFQPIKLNYEMLGNTDRHLHWHIFPRYGTDPKPSMPVWHIDKSITYAESVRPTEKELAILKEKLMHALKNTASNIRLEAGLGQNTDQT